MKMTKYKRVLEGRCVKEEYLDERIMHDLDKLYDLIINSEVILTMIKENNIPSDKVIPFIEQYINDLKEDKKELEKELQILVG